MGTAGALAACRTALPDPESPGAKLYAEQCGLCHRAYAPVLLKPAMWELQVERMQGKRVERGLAPLPADEVRRILEYLTAHAG